MIRQLVLMFSAVFAAEGPGPRLSRSIFLFLRLSTSARPSRRLGASCSQTTVRFVMPTYPECVRMRRACGVSSAARPPLYRIFPIPMP